MDKYLAMLIVAAVAAAFYGVSYLKKRKMYPLCDRFAIEYCDLADRLLEHTSAQQSLATEKLDGGLFRILPMQDQSEEIQSALKRPIDDAVLASVRNLFLLREFLLTNSFKVTNKNQTQLIKFLMEVSWKVTIPPFKLFRIKKWKFTTKENSFPVLKFSRTSMF